MKRVVSNIGRAVLTAVYGRWFLAGIVVHANDELSRLERELKSERSANKTLIEQNRTLQASLLHQCAETQQLQEFAKRERNRHERKSEECDSLTRQRDTALDMLERVQWEARVATAKSMVVASGLQSAKG